MNYQGLPKALCAYTFILFGGFVKLAEIQENDNMKSFIAERTKKNDSVQEEFFHVKLAETHGQDSRPMRYVPPHIKNSIDVIRTTKNDSVQEHLPIIETEFFNNCSTYNSCALCLNSDYECNWDIVNVRCTHKAHVNNNVLLMHSRNTQDCSIFFYPIIEQPSYMFIPATATTNIAKVNYKSPIIKVSFRNFECSFQVENRTITVNTISYATPRDENCTIPCDGMTFTHYVNQTNTVDEFTINNEQSHLSNVHGTRVFLYKCDLMDDRCKTCLDLVQKIKCRWHDDDSSQIENCLQRSVCNATYWSNLCKTPSQFSFTPNIAPGEGGTIVSINYKGWFPIIHKITVAGRDCQLEYKFLNECKLPQIRSVFNHSSGPVILHFFNQKIISDSNFQFVNPIVEKFQPSRGPKCGGTDITIYGTHMNAGSQIKVFFGDLECAVIELFSETLKCVTSPSNQAGKHEVVVQFDGNGRPVKKHYFYYDEDMEPDNSIHRVPRGTPSGGINIFVSADNILPTQVINMIVFAIDGERNFSSSCRVFGSTQLICPSPVFTGIHENELAQLNYGFFIGNEYLNITKTYPKFLLYPELDKLLLLGAEISKKGTWLNDNIGLFMIATITVVNLIVITSSIIYRKKCMETQRNIQQTNNTDVETISMPEIERVIVEENTESRELELPNVSFILAIVPRHQAEEYSLPLDNAWEFPRTNLTLEECLGQGEFGKVVKGRAIGILEESIVTRVAVKMLKSIHKDTDMACLVSEMEVMKLLGKPGHENVLQLLGCCTQGGPLFVITEYASQGNLHDFLRKHELVMTDQLIPGELNEKTLISFATQVAKGMEYLVLMRCIHRDLAARNILVSDNNIMKIADFGLAKNARGKYYYQQKSHGRVPVKWMAPEAFNQGRSTFQSDVWSYGILLWEIMTLGSNPYPSFTAIEELLPAITSGYRMEKPHYCSTKIYELMCQCWNHEPKDRPTFSFISTKLEEIETSYMVTEYVNMATIILH